MVEPAKPLQNRAFPVWGIDLFARLQLDFADGQNVPGPFIQQLDDLRVELVDRLPMLRDVHEVDSDSGGLSASVPAL